MKRKAVIFIVAWILLLTACGSENLDDGGALAQFSIELAQTGEDTIRMQKKLAQWYNLNLKAEHPDVGFERKYDSILFFTDGIMGYVEIPDMGLCIPIYHDFERNGFFLDPYSSFPTGGEGNHTELYTEQTIELKQGDVFRIYVLDEVLTYRIGEAGSDRCTLICADVAYDAARMVED